jgi:hypothetical protein
MAHSLDQIDTMLRRADASRNIAEQSVIFLALLKDDPTRDFCWIEQRLRDLDCKLLYLLGMPAALMPPGMAIFDPRNPDGAAPLYWVWHSVNGLAERTASMRQYRIPSNLDNRERLRCAGYLNPR